MCELVTAVPTFEDHSESRGDQAGKRLVQHKEEVLGESKWLLTRFSLLFWAGHYLTPDYSGKKPSELHLHLNMSRGLPLLWLEGYESLG